MEINSANDDVESKNIEFFSQNSKDFKLSDALEMKRLEKNYQINHNMPNLTGIKSRIDTGLRRNKENLNFNRTGMTNNFFKKDNDITNILNNNPKLSNNLKSNYDDTEENFDNLYSNIEKDNKSELKEFIQKVMANKIEKRNNYFDPKNVIFKFKNFTNLLIIF